MILFFLYKIGHREARYSGGPQIILLCFHISTWEESGIKELSRRSRWRGCLGPRLHDDSHFIHSFHFLLSWPSGLYYPERLEWLHFYLNCFHKTDQRSTLLFLEHELSNFSTSRDHLDPFLKSFRSSDLPHLGRHSGIWILTSTLDIVLGP